MHIRPATPADVPAIAAVYGEHVRHGTASFEEVPPDEDEMAARMARIRGGGWPWLIAEVEGAVAGYAYAGQLNPRSGYRYACEDSIYVAADRHGIGVGTALLGRLIEDSSALGFRTMLAIIGDSANTGSIALHRRFGFEHVGTMRNVGYKFGRWLDVVTMQLTFPETR